VFPETREQRCWWHKIGNVLNALPKSAQPGAKKALAEIWNAEDKDHAQAAANVFADYGTKWPSSVILDLGLTPRQWDLRPGRCSSTRRALRCVGS
jgi:transposase-like protein